MFLYPLLVAWPFLYMELDRRLTQLFVQLNHFAPDFTTFYPYLPGWQNCVKDQNFVNTLDLLPTFLLSPFCTGTIAWFVLRSCWKLRHQPQHWLFRGYVLLLFHYAYFWTQVQYAPQPSLLSYYAVTGWKAF